jgi:protein-S-isoprenylcysteine O-methyltransferase Ste14
LLLYPHWLFAVLGVMGAIILHWSTGYEERRLTERFGSDYQAYMQRVPRMNLILGIIRSYRRRRSS